MPKPLIHGCFREKDVDGFFRKESGKGNAKGTAADGDPFAN